MKKLSFFLTLFLTLNSFAQSPSIQWQKTYGSNGDDEFGHLWENSDGTYLITGWSDSANGDVTTNKGYADYWIAKINSAGTILWQKSYGGSSGDYGCMTKPTPDGNYITIGASSSNDGDVSGNHSLNNYDDYWVIKVDTIGNILWQKCYGGTSSDVGCSIQPTNDKGYVLGGLSYSNDGDVSGNHGGVYDVWIVKIDSMGIIKWQKTLGGSGDEIGNVFVFQTKDNGYIVSCPSTSTDGDVTGNHGAEDYWVVKLDSLGNIKWQKSYGGTASDQASHIIQTSDGGYAVTGFSNSNNGDVSGNHGQSDYWVVKLDTIGNILWEKSLGGSNSESENWIEQTSDGGYIISGESYSNDGNVSGQHGTIGCDYWTVKLTQNGNIQWESCFGGSWVEDCDFIKQTSDGGYMIGGDTESNDGDITLNRGSTDFWIIKLNPEVAIKNEYQSNRLMLFPNPSTGSFNFESDLLNALLTVKDVYGNIIERKMCASGKINFNLETHPNGIYFLEINAADCVISKKIIIQH